MTRYLTLIGAALALIVSGCATQGNDGAKVADGGAVYRYKNGPVEVEIVSSRESSGATLEIDSDGTLRSRAVDLSGAGLSGLLTQGALQGFLGLDPAAAASNLLDLGLTPDEVEQLLPLLIQGRGAE